MDKGNTLTQDEQDEDAFSSWNRDITDYEPTLWDAYLFGLRRGRGLGNGDVATPAELMEYVPTTGWKS